MQPDNGLPVESTATAVLPHKTQVDVRDMGAIGDGVTDDSAAFQHAIDASQQSSGALTVYVPNGNYIVGGVILRSGNKIQGESIAAVLKAKSGASYILGINPMSEGTPDVATNVSNVEISSLSFEGRSVEDGFVEHHHLLNLNAASHISIHDTEFRAFPGDGIYVGTGYLPGFERHNVDIQVLRSKFDGVNYQNRNAISIIDCDGCVVSDNDFKRVSHFKMPGGFCSEPDQAFDIVRNITVRNNTFDDIRGSAGAISLIFASKKFRTPPNNFLIETNTVTSGSDGGIVVLWNGTDATDSTPKLGVIIQNNVISNVGRGFVLDGVRDVTITNNKVTNTTHDVILGYKFNVVDVTITGNTFTSLSNVQGDGFTIAGNAARLIIDTNKFIDVGSRSGEANVFSLGKGKVDTLKIINNEFSSPNKITHYAVQTKAGHSSVPGSDVWSGNTLSDGIKLGSFDAATPK
jgi:hypothetical protein